MSTTLAERLIAAGIPVVVVKAGDKPPLNWESAVADYKALRSYVPGRDALAMVGGHGIDGVDVDMKEGKHGSLSALPPFKWYGVTRTPSGGRHYIVPSCGVGKISPLQTDQGFVGDYCGGRPDGSGRMLVFLPGSRRTKYPDGGYVEEEPWDVDACLAADPDPALVRALTEAGGHAERPASYVDHSERRLANAGLHPYAAAGITDELRRLDDCELLGWAGDGWDGTTFQVACNLIEFANSGWSGYSLDAAHADLLERAPTDERFGVREHEAKWASALARVGGNGRRNPGRSSPAEDFDRVPDATESAVQQRFPRLNLAALLDPNRPPRDWVVAGLVIAGASVSLVAPAGSMKSLIMLALSLAVARGDEDWAGLTIPKQRRVLYADMENTEDDLAERMKSLGAQPVDLEELVYLHLPALPMLDTRDGGATLLSILDEYGIGVGDVVVLDSTQRVVGGPENDADTYRAFYNYTAAALKKRGVTVLRTDNSGKDIDRGARGSSSKRDDVDIELRMERDGDLVTIRVGKARIGGIEPLQVRAGEDDDGRLTFTAGPVRVSADQKVHRMKERVSAFLGENPGAITREIKAARLGDNTVVTAALNGLVDDGYVEVIVEGRKNTHHQRKPYAPEFES